MQNSPSVFFDIHKQLLSSDPLARQVTEAEGKLQTSHYYDEKKGWNWDKYVTLHKVGFLQTMATVEWKMVPRSATFFKTTKVLS